VIEYVLADLDMVLLMSVNPGFGGQDFIPGVIPKIGHLRKMIDEKGLDVEIEVDGGINPNTINNVSSAGCDIFVAGSAIFKTEDYAETIRILKSRM
jgi:ribulose-phosphate 3-epimerase